MSESRDNLERLRSLNPVDLDQVEGPDSERAQDLLARVLQTPRPATRRSAAQRTVRLAAVLAILALFLLAATWLLTREVETPQSIACYQAVDLDSDVAAAPPGRPATAEACAQVWDDNVLTNPDLVPAGSVPPLTACVTQAGTLAVFPTGDSTVCETLGLAHPEPSSQDEADQVRQLDTSLNQFFASSDCVAIEDAVARVRQILNDSGFSEWTIQQEQATGARPCASYSLNAPTQTINIIPIPEP